MFINWCIELFFLRWIEVVGKYSFHVFLIIITVNFVVILVEYLTGEEVQYYVNCTRAPYTSRSYLNFQDFPSEKISCVLTTVRIWKSHISFSTAV